MEISEGTNMNPRISYDERSNSIEISGWSFCEKPMDVYRPVFDIIETMMTHRESPLSLNFNLACFNTATTKSIFEMVRLIDAESKVKGREYEINWFYNDEDPETREWGEDLSMACGIPFNYRVDHNQELI